MKSRMNRRNFLAVSGGLAAAVPPNRARPATASAVDKPEIGGKCKILRLFLGARPSWPHPKLNLKTEMARFIKAMDKVPGLEGVEFVGNGWVRSNYEAQLYIKRFGSEVGGILACNLCLGTSPMLATLLKSGIPTVVFSIPYSGHEWYMVPDLWRGGHRVDVVATGDFKDVVKAVRPLRAIFHLKRTRILYVGGGLPLPKGYPEALKKKIGPEVVPCPYERIKKAYEAVDPRLAAEEADRWIRAAQEVVEPSREEIVKSCRVYFALARLLREEKAQVVTINCLGGFYSHVPAYPCLAFSRLNDEGLCGVCEADITSAVTQVIFLYLAGVPGFVTDPVINTADNTVIHAHCMSATRMDGPKGPRAPFKIRNHLEDLRSASLQVFMRKGQVVTVAKLVARDTRPYQQRRMVMAATPFESIGVDQMLISTGTIVGVPTVERGCRTKVTVRVRNAQRMLETWTAGLHRVLFYGDHMEDIRRLSRLLKFEVVEEGVA